MGGQISAGWGRFQLGGISDFSWGEFSDFGWGGQISAGGRCRVSSGGSSAFNLWARRLKPSALSPQLGDLGFQPSVGGDPGSQLGDLRSQLGGSQIPARSKAWDFSWGEISDFS